MKTFLDRIGEQLRIERQLNSVQPVFLTVYGRRRCGKSALLNHLKKPKDVFFQCDQQEETIQRNLLAQEIANQYPGFSEVNYPSWESLLNNLNKYLSTQSTLFLDEFPYLVKSSPSFPSVLQRLIDQKKLQYNLVICGSSQQMMQGLIMDSKSPLYGRTDDIIRILPLKAGWIQEGLALEPIQAIEEYAVWGGVPRYWVLRSKQANFESAVANLLLNSESLLYEEPMRLFLDDMRSAVQTHSIMLLAGSGTTRQSEFATRLEKSATSLARPLAALIEMGYLRRELPFGENEKNSKRGLYKINDPFMRFQYRFVIANKSRIESGINDRVIEEWRKNFAQFIGETWEQLCREALPFLNINNQDWDIARRWWGNATSKVEFELDLVSESVDKKSLLIGECKWSDNPNIKSICKNLDGKIKLFPLAQKRKIQKVLFLKLEPNEDVPKDYIVVTPQTVLNALR